MKVSTAAINEVFWRKRDKNGQTELLLSANE